MMAGRKTWEELLFDDLVDQNTFLYTETNNMINELKKEIQGIQMKKVFLN